MEFNIALVLFSVALLGHTLDLYIPFHKTYPVPRMKVFY